MIERLGISASVALAAAAMSAPAPALAQQAAISEFRNRELGQFSSQDHPKASGLHVTIGYPRSWQVKEGRRPHVVQNFLATDGTGSNCNLLVRPLDKVSPAQAAEILHPSKLREFVPATFTYRSGGQTTIGGQPAAQVIVERPFEGLNGVSHQRLVIYVSIYRSNLVNLTCGVGAPNVSQADQRLDAHLPLFGLVKDSLVLRN